MKVRFSKQSSNICNPINLKGYKQNFCKAEGVSFTSSKDRFVSSKSLQYGYMKLEDAMKKISEFGIKSVADFSALSKFCTSKGMVYIPALLLAVKMFESLKTSEDDTVVDCCKYGEINFFNLMSSVKSGKRFDNEKITLASKIENPFDVISLMGDIEYLKIGKNIYPILNQCMDIGTDSKFLLEGIDKLNDEKQPYSNLLKMVKLNKLLNNTNAKNLFKNKIALKCYMNPEPALEFYTEDVLSVIRDFDSSVFRPNNIECAKNVKKSLFDFYTKRGSDDGVIILTTEKQNHYLKYLSNNKDKNVANLYVQSFNSNGETISIENTEFYDVNENKDDGYYAKSHFDDLMKNVTIERKFKRENEYKDILIEQKITRKSKDGNIIKTEYYKQSPIEGAYDVFYSYPDGRVEIVSRGVENPLSGEKLIKENINSQDNIVSKILYKENRSGKTNYQYLISSPENAEILNRSIQKYYLDDNTIESIVDGKKYQIKNNGKTVTVGEVLKDGTIAKKYYLHVGGKSRNSVSQEFVPLIMKLSPDMLINFIKNKLKLNKAENRGSFSPASKTIDLNSDTIDSSFVFSHEFAHALDIELIVGLLFKYNLSNNKSLNKILRKELGEFKNNEPDLILNRDLGYFFNFTNEERGRAEFFADSVGMFNSCVDTNICGSRTYELRRSFPLAIAKCVEIYKKIKDSFNK